MCVTGYKFLLPCVHQQRQPHSPILIGHSDAADCFFVILSKYFEGGQLLLAAKVSYELPADTAEKPSEQIAKVQNSKFNSAKETYEPIFYLSILLNIT